MSCLNPHSTVNVFNIAYNVDFIKTIQEEIAEKYSREVNKQYNSKKYDLGCNFTNDKLVKLKRYDSILTKIINCNTCFSGMNIEIIVGQVKRNINEL